MNGHVGADEGHAEVAAAGAAAVPAAETTMNGHVVATGGDPGDPSLAAFLESCGAAEHLRSCEEQGFESTRALVEAQLSEADLRELGLDKMAQRKRVLHALVAAWKGGASPRGDERGDEEEGEWGVAEEEEVGRRRAVRRAGQARAASSTGQSQSALSDEERATRVAAIAAATGEVLGQLGEDVAREGLVKTPLRVAKAMLDLTSGYRLSLQDVVGDAVSSGVSLRPEVGGLI
jgi:hypothetical protein